MNRFAFPYGIRFQEDGRMEVFPAAELFVLGRGGRGLRAIFHIDSGATTSILPASDADALGIRSAEGRKIIVRGIAGEPMVGYQYAITIELGRTKKQKVPAVFVENDLVPRILGREGVFTRFGVLFDETKRRTAFLDAKSERKTIDALFAWSALQTNALTPAEGGGKRTRSCLRDSQ